MERCTYRVLEFAKSEREARGLMFAIIIRFDELREHFFKSLYLNGWKSLIGDAFQEETGYVEDALHGLRLYAHKPFSDSEEALALTEEMSAGVLRTALRGTAMLPAFPRIHCELGTDQDSQTCSAEAFAAMVNALLGGSLADLDGEERFARS